MIYWHGVESTFHMDRRGTNLFFSPLKSYNANPFGSNFFYISRLALHYMCPYARKDLHPVTFGRARTEGSCCLSPTMHATIHAARINRGRETTDGVIMPASHCLSQVPVRGRPRFAGYLANCPPGEKIFSFAEYLRLKMSTGRTFRRYFPGVSPEIRWRR